ncbi:UBA-e1-C domain-containing protein [Mycena chlorophos]|uniref:UBA-e1-C domain-containing protein n=1 Tax=Mycena chlorophos TaxID=658473 RepID=A0A8H6SAZ0_MYCCL|nr:UBA-e1-C domain-containing protein [Mycena chlorophos]
MSTTATNSTSSSSTVSQSEYNALVLASLIPLHAVLVGLTWILHDYVVTLEDEIRYIWPQKFNFSKFMFIWIRYYRLVLHSCSSMLFRFTSLLAPTLLRQIFVLRWILSSVWLVQGPFGVLKLSCNFGSMQSMDVPNGQALLTYPWSPLLILFKVAAFNFILFCGSIAGFLWILIFNHSRRAAVIASVIHLDLPGCPSVHSGIEWAQWVPATIFEGILFAFALAKTLESSISSLRRKKRLSLFELLLRDNILYFFGITAILVFNNVNLVLHTNLALTKTSLKLMVVTVTHIPWFSYGPFHAAVGVMTTRMLISLRKATIEKSVVDMASAESETVEMMNTGAQKSIPRLRSLADSDTIVFGGDSGGTL